MVDWSTPIDLANSVQSRIIKDARIPIHAIDKQMIKMALRRGTSWARLGLGADGNSDADNISSETQTGTWHEGPDKDKYSGMGTLFSIVFITDVRFSFDWLLSRSDFLFLTLSKEEESWWDEEDKDKDRGVAGDHPSFSLIMLNVKCYKNIYVLTFINN